MKSNALVAFPLLVCLGAAQAQAKDIKCNVTLHQEIHYSQKVLGEYSYSPSVSCSAEFVLETSKTEGLLSVDLNKEDFSDCVLDTDDESSDYYLGGTGLTKKEAAAANLPVSPRSAVDDSVFKDDFQYSLWLRGNAMVPVKDRVFISDLTIDLKASPESAAIKVNTMSEVTYEKLLQPYSWGENQMSLENYLGLGFSKIRAYLKCE